jgi:hypothetical protein
MVSKFVDLEFVIVDVLAVSVGVKEFKDFFYFLALVVGDSWRTVEWSRDGEWGCESEEEGIMLIPRRCE